MPYIRRIERPLIDGWIATRPGIANAGELNYVITKLLLSWDPGLRGYTLYNNMLGVLECVKLELYRRMVAPYEDRKKEENGDVFPKENE